MGGKEKREQSVTFRFVAWRTQKLVAPGCGIEKTGRGPKPSLRTVSPVNNLWDTRAGKFGSAAQERGPLEEIDCESSFS